MGAPHLGPSPVRVVGVSGVMALAAGWEHTVALRADGAVWTWGTTPMASWETDLGEAELARAGGGVERSDRGRRERVALGGPARGRDGVDLGAQHSWDSWRRDLGEPEHAGASAGVERGGSGGRWRGRRRWPCAGTERCGRGDTTGMAR